MHMYYLLPPDLFIEAWTLRLHSQQTAELNKINRRIRFKIPQLKLLMKKALNNTGVQIGNVLTEVYSSGSEAVAWHNGTTGPL